ncbi:uncharacterized protein LOC132194615 [Neocloeon triangulifer]|uniref:uncharacterized protein LOC132194615 n=1 Tax=Neocloeon triangulifer TaxID=2078957 RepID=UPI00286EF2FF|nr:uncharacterized protein LOC132194615 [Neocloeon triangulifer]
MFLSSILRKPVFFWQIHRNSLHLYPCLLRQTVDYSKVPVLNENELEEQFVKGHGPGGQNVNKRSNCVLLKHLPTGLVVKAHQARLLDTNRRIARELLVDKLDQLRNGEESVASQKKRIEERKSSKNESKKRKMQELKAAWKEREGNLQTKVQFAVEKKIFTGFSLLQNPIFNIVRFMSTIDYSKVPTIDEADLEEQIIRGSGTHKDTNCILIIHKPTGIVVKGSKSRNLIENRKIAREILIEKLDQKLNGEKSVAAQKKRVEARKSSNRDYKRKKLQQLKEASKANQVE